MPHGTITFHGVAGRYRCRVTTADDELHLAARGSVGPIRPTDAAWLKFWAVVDELGAWRWAAEYGRMIKDGRPWWLTLGRGELALATAGNDYEEHAPPGVRTLVLALDELLAGRLLHPDDASLLRRRYKLRVLVTKDPRPPISDLVLLGRLFERAAPWPVHQYILGRERDGASFLLDAPPPDAELAAVRHDLADRDPALSLLDLSTGAETPL